MQLTSLYRKGPYIFSDSSVPWIQNSRENLQQQVQHNCAWPKTRFLISRKFHNSKLKYIELCVCTECSNCERIKKMTYKSLSSLSVSLQCRSICLARYFIPYILAVPRHRGVLKFKKNNNFRCKKGQPFPCGILEMNCSLCGFVPVHCHFRDIRIKR